MTRIPAGGPDTATEGSGPEAAAPAVLDVRGLGVAFHTRRGVARAVSDVSFSLRAGETLGLVGESGSGKSTTLAAVLGMVSAPGRVSSGEIHFQGRDLVREPESRLRAIRGRAMALVPQDAGASLNPLLTIGRQIEENLRAHGGPRGAAAQERIVELLTTVGISEPAKRAHAYPHQLSGGMRQRVMIAMALINEP
ncbi:MAG: ATP-binding cassette domain-containing protein, partial [Conexibacter sp.]